MHVVKSTEGYVEQLFDLETGELTSQKFVANCDDIAYQDEDGGDVNDDRMYDLYAPFTMEQPSVTPTELWVICENVSVLEQGDWATNRVLLFGLGYFTRICDAEAVLDELEQRDMNDEDYEDGKYSVELLSQGKV
jgi:hypothetical protein